MLADASDNGEDFEGTGVESCNTDSWRTIRYKALYIDSKKCAAVVVRRKALV